MNFHILTLFPEMIMQGLSTSITGRAMENNIISVNAVNIRDFSEDKHGHVDDYPYGGGAGMVMKAGPVYRAYEHVMKSITDGESTDCSVKDDSDADYLTETEDNVSVNELLDEFDDKNLHKKRPRVIYMTPQGRVFNQQIAHELSAEEDLIFLCGHYEGIDERVLDMIVTDNISIGDYVLTGGELPAMVVIDAISRLVPGVLGSNVSAEFETFHDDLLEYPQYTRPEEFMGVKVPEVLLSGHHKNIEKWRKEQSEIRTKERRPDLWERYKKMSDKA